MGFKTDNKVEMVNEPNFLVKVTCMTYNHANYITDAMDGFVMQQTSFPFVCIIIDDASTDGEPGIIKKYIDEYFDRLDIGLATEDETDEYLRIYARHKENKNCYFCVLLLKYNHYSIKKPKTNNLAGFAITRKYLAICEGDDYWTDPLKLQKQVDFLENHGDVGLCYTDYSRFDEATKLITHSMFEEQGQYRPTSYEQHLLKPGYLAPMTWVYRAELNNYLEKKSGFVDGTYVLMLEWFYHSKVEYLPINTAVYRSHKGSASSPIDANERFRYYKGVFDTQLYYANKYPCPEVLLEKIKVRGYLDVLPVAIMAENEDFIKESKSYLESKGYSVEAIIRDLKEGQSVRKSYAYRLGKAIVSPLSWLKKKCKSF